MTTLPLESFLLPGHSSGPAPVGMLAVQTAQGSAEEGNTDTNSVISSHVACPACPWPSWPARDNMPCPQGCHWHQDPSVPVHPSLSHSFISAQISSTCEEWMCPGQQDSDSLLSYSDSGKHSGFGTLHCNRPSTSNKNPLPPKTEKNTCLLLSFYFFSPKSISSHLLIILHLS